MFIKQKWLHQLKQSRQAEVWLDKHICSTFKHTHLS